MSSFPLSIEPPVARPPRLERRRDPAIAAALVLGVIAIYAQTYAFAFVNYDDQDYVYENATVRQGLSVRTIGWAFTTGHAANWHPLTWLSHLIDVELFGTWAGGHHLTAVVFHALNAVLLFALLRLMTGRLWPCAFAAALFAWHPLRAESVAWVSERKDVLSTCFGLLSLIAYTVHARRPRPGGWYVASLGLLALSLMSKAMFVTMPFVMLLLDVWPLRRIDRLDRRRIVTFLVEKLPFFGLAIASAIVTYLVQSDAGAVMAKAQIPPGPRVMNAIVSVVGYLRMTLAPYGLASYYPHPYTIPGRTIPLAAVVGSITLIGAISAAAILTIRRRPYLAVGWFWFLGTLVPVIGLVQVGNQALADRYTYVPGIGLAIAVVWLLADVAARRGMTRTIVVGFGIFTLLAYGVVAYGQAATWRDSVTLMRRGVEAVPDSFVAHNNLGIALDGLGQLDEAEREYRTALGLFAADPGGNTNLAGLLTKTGRADEAKTFLDRAIASDPRFSPAYATRAEWHLVRGERDAAFADFERAIALKPADKRAYHNYALALAQAGRLEEAKRRWREAIALDPNYAIALDGYGRALLLTGETAEGHRVLRQAIALEPTNGSTLYLLAWSLATNADAAQRNPREAAAVATAALKLQPKNVLYADALAAAWAAGGRFAEAAKLAEGAADAATDPRQADAIRARASLYRAGKPYITGTGS